MDIKKKTNFIERTDAMKSYLKDLNKLKVMTPEREKALFDERKKPFLLPLRLNVYEVAHDIVADEKPLAGKMKVVVANL